MAEFTNKQTRDGFTCKLWRGERMTMVGFDVEEPEPDLVGFSIEVKAPGESEYQPLMNRIAFEYPEGAEAAVTGDRKYDSRLAPFQKFRWIHFPWEPVDGTYSYKVTKRHMPEDGMIVPGTTIDLDIDQAAVTYDGLVDIGFTRNFASSQAYREQFGNNADIIPVSSEDGLDFEKSALKNSRGQSVYEWLGFEAYELLFHFLDAALEDDSLTVDVMAYDLNEPDFVGRLRRFGSRLRIIVDDSEPHLPQTSAESRSAALLQAAGASVVRTHFQNLQHNKIVITRRDGIPERVLCGSTNFTFRGLYIQANNMLVFHSAGVADLFGRMFDLAWANPLHFQSDPFAKKWHMVETPGKPTIELCFSPHTDPLLSLNEIASAVNNASSSVLYSVAFLNQITSGPTADAFRKLINRPIFSYGTVDNEGSLELRKPDGTAGLVDFDYLASKAPQPFAAEWSGGKGRNVHHKFVVTDFNLPTARVFTGSSNFSKAGEKGNGDQLIMMKDRKVALAYAIEAVRVFDHLQFRNRMRDALQASGAAPPKPITLRKPVSISGDEKPWFERFYREGSQAWHDRKLFSI